ncbi:YggS family pyridoxal phosphate-dependent enzyme [Acidisoma cellulosilytica]|uniref:Pyridoxal phosphate homeostasis protein n=1 Tax=Acidisoma cellulosilyticum TaxID=2802395 RepID=A0A964E3V6_9PROT|nr:YggS family pyridoxal phosphate-dependent enzyme [Acidisoma cellulosilyticum]MCB8880829.1 YggS family pyridoxal phosphate-dependent enzyme [Acidisoma cellulosilyticum]
MAQDSPDSDFEPLRHAITASLTRMRGELDAAALAAGRDPAAVSLVAVSKFHPEAAVRAAILAGQRVFGENRVQEAAGKFAALRAERTEFRLHIIGGLQTNKARNAVRIADVIETLDRPKLADAIAEAAEREGRLPDLFVQVNVGDEAQKGGVAMAEADSFIESVQQRFGARLRGLMCIPPAESDPKPHFLWLQGCAKRHGLAELSMGMSGDFAAAIACGATQVRIGTAIFGHRPAAGTADVSTPSL